MLPNIVAKFYVKVNEEKDYVEVSENSDLRYDMNMVVTYNQPCRERLISFVKRSASAQDHINFVNRFCGTGVTTYLTVWHPCAEKRYTEIRSYTSEFNRSEIIRFSYENKGILISVHSLLDENVAYLLNIVCLLARLENISSIEDIHRSVFAIEEYAFATKFYTSLYLSLWLKDKYYFYHDKFTSGPAQFMSEYFTRSSRKGVLAMFKEHMEYLVNELNITLPTNNSPYFYAETVMVSLKTLLLETGIIMEEN